ncbi:hypothetical protein [Niallia sp. 03133]
MHSYSKKLIGVGKRTLLKMEKTISEEHELIQYFYKVNLPSVGVFFIPH